MKDSLKIWKCNNSPLTVKTKTIYHSFQVNANTTLKINHLLKKKPKNNDFILMKESSN